MLAWIIIGLCVYSFFDGVSGLLSPTSTDDDDFDRKEARNNDDLDEDLIVNEIIDKDIFM